MNTISQYSTPLARFLTLVLHTKVVNTFHHERSQIMLKRSLHALLSLIVVLAGITIHPGATHAQGVTFALPYGPEAGDIKATRTGRLYEQDYRNAGLTYMTSGDYHDPSSTTRGAIDFTLSYKPVYAAAAGKVIEAKNCHVYIEHGDGSIKSYYEHLSKLMVKPGDLVYPYTQIGVSGNGCGSDGAHLHFAVFNKVNGSWKEVKAYFADASALATGGLIRPSHMSGNPTYIYKANAKKTQLPVIFDHGVSTLWQDQSWGRANLKVCADNLNGNTVNVLFYRDGRSWTPPPQRATSNCVTFWDMDGAGPLNRGTTYFSRAALNQPPSTSWPIPLGEGLYDSIRRP